MSNLLKISNFATFILLFIIANCELYADYFRTVNQYKIYGQEKDSSIINFLQGVVFESNAKYEKFFLYSIKGPVRIRLTSSEKEYARITSKSVPEWSSGVAFVQQKIIILKPGKYFDKTEYERLLMHEIVHIFLSEKIGIGKIPLWLNEGTAMYLSQESISWNEGIILGNAIVSGNLLSFSEMDSLLKFGQIKARIAYLESFLAVQFLINRFGEKALLNILGDFSSKLSANEIFLKNIGMDLIDFEIDWYAFVKDKYRWMVWMQFENVFWFVLVLIIIVSFISIKLRNRRTIKNWENEND